MSTLNRIRGLGRRSIQALHQDEEGLNTIEMVLIVCAAALLLWSAYSYLWGNENDGIIAKMINTVIDKFTSTFSNAIGG
jgi:Flp pilus assembly pilin Flp